MRLQGAEYIAQFIGIIAMGISYGVISVGLWRLFRWLKLQKVNNENLKKSISILLILLMLLNTSCYSTYEIKKEEIESQEKITNVTFDDDRIRRRGDKLHPSCRTPVIMIA